MFKLVVIGGKLREKNFNFLMKTLLEVIHLAIFFLMSKEFQKNMFLLMSTENLFTPKI